MYLSNDRVYERFQSLHLSWLKGSCNLVLLQMPYSLMLFTNAIVFEIHSWKTMAISKIVSMLIHQTAQPGTVPSYAMATFSSKWLYMFLQTYLNNPLQMIGSHLLFINECWRVWIHHDKVDLPRKQLERSSPNLLSPLWRQRLYWGMSSGQTGRQRMEDISRGKTAYTQ